MRALLLPFGLRDGQLVNVNAVERGQGCDCVCPHCHEPLVAKKGSHNTHHFAHLSNSDCGAGLETALHLAAKEAIETARGLRLPAVTIQFDSYAPPWTIHEEQYVFANKVKLEERHDSVIPDVVVYLRDRPLFVEINVTHGVSEAKEQWLRKRRISAIEVVLKDMDHQLTLEAIQQAVVGSVSQKKWIFNRKAQQALAFARKHAISMRHVYHGCALHVNDCPLPARRWRGMPYANVIDDCVHCDFCVSCGLNGEGKTLCIGQTGAKNFAEFKRSFVRLPNSAPNISCLL